MSKVYFTIFTTEETIEYHVSSEKKDVVRGEAMSSKISRDHHNPIPIIERWFQSAKVHQQVPVTCTKHMALPLVLG